MANKLAETSSFSKYHDIKNTSYINFNQLQVSSFFEFFYPPNVTYQACETFRIL